MIPELEDIKRLLLNDWDPIGIVAIKEAVDEYDSYAMQVFSMLAHGADTAKISEYLRWVVTSRMGLADNSERDAELAKRAIAIHKDHLSDGA